MLLARVHRTPESLLELKEAWQQLPVPTPFCSWEFAQHWLETHPDTEPFVISVRDASGVVAIAPWSLVRRRTRLGSRLVTGFGEGDSYYHDPVLTRLDPAVAERLADALKATQGSWDGLQLKFRLAHSQPLVSRLKGLGQSVERRGDDLDNRLIDLSEGWESYYEAFPANWRRNIRRCERKVADMPHRYLEANHQNYDHLVKELFRLHLAHWDSPEARASFRAVNSPERWQALYDSLEALGRHELSFGRSCLYALEIDGRVAAVDFVWPWGHSAFLLLRAYDQAFSPLSVGHLLGFWEFQRLYERGVRTIDLGPGQYRYKDRLRNRTAETVHLQVLPGLKGTLYGCWREYVKPWLSTKPALRGAPALLAATRLR